MMIYLIPLGIALLGGLVARGTVLRFWGGFFLQMFATALFFPILGPMGMLPGILFILMLQRFERKHRQHSRYACPFSAEVRDQCMQFNQQQCPPASDPGVGAEAPAATCGAFRKDSFLKRNAHLLILLPCALAAILYGRVTEDGEKKKPRQRSSAMRSTSHSVAARSTAATSPSSPTSSTI